MLPQELVIISSKIFILILFITTLLFLILGKINSKGLFADKVTGRFSMSRLQLLIVTILVSGNYLSDFFNVNNSNQFPELSTDIVLLAGASQLYYLRDKYLSGYFNKEAESR
jgi:hypothetical protein